MATFYIFFAQAMSAVLKLSLVFQEKIEKCNKFLDKTLKEINESEKIKEKEKQKAKTLAKKAKTNLKFLGWVSHGFCYSLMGLFGTLTMPEISAIPNENLLKNLSILVCGLLLMAIAMLLLPYHLNKHFLRKCHKKIMFGNKNWA